MAQSKERVLSNYQRGLYSGQKNINIIHLAIIKYIRTVIISSNKYLSMENVLLI
jgi:hypothetical protein